MSGVNGIGSSSNLINNTSRMENAKNKNTNSNELSYNEAAILNEIKDIMIKNFGDIDVRLDNGTLQPNGMKIEVTGFRKDNPADINSKSWYSLSRTELKKMAEDENYKKEFLNKIMVNVDEEHHMRGQKNNTTNKRATGEEETQTETFVNSKGEKVLAIKTSFGVRYIKLGEVQDFLLSDNKAVANIETILEKTYGI